MKSSKDLLLTFLMEIETIENLIEGQEFFDFKKDDKKRDLIIAQFDKLEQHAHEIAKKLSKTFPHYHWKPLIELKKKGLSHQAHPDFHAFWTIIKYELPGIKEEMDTLYEKIEAEEKNRKL